MNKAALLSLFRHSGKLKTIKRTGWINREIRDPESVSDHSYRVSLIALFLSGYFEVDPLKLLRMSIIHDLAESVVGDITPHCGVPSSEKHVKEKRAFETLLDDLPEKEAMLALWLEYEEGASPEALLLKNIDKFEMALQAVEYQELHPEKDLSEFIRAAGERIDDEKIRSLLEALPKVN